MYQAKAWHGPLSVVSSCFPPDFSHSSASYFCHSASCLIVPITTQTSAVLFQRCKETDTEERLDHMEALVFCRLQGSMHNNQEKYGRLLFCTLTLVARWAFTHNAHDIQPVSLFSHQPPLSLSPMYCLSYSTETKTKTSFKVCACSIITRI